MLIDLLFMECAWADYNAPEFLMESTREKNAQKYFVSRGIEILQNYIKQNKVEDYMNEIFRLEKENIRAKLLERIGNTQALFDYAQGGDQKSVQFKDVKKGIAKNDTSIEKLRRQYMLFDVLSLIWVFDTFFDSGKDGGSFSLYDSQGHYKAMRDFFEAYIRMTENPKNYESYRNQPKPAYNDFVANRTPKQLSSHYVKQRITTLELRDKQRKTDPKALKGYSHFGISSKFKGDQPAARILKGKKAEFLYGVVQMNPEQGSSSREKLFFKTERNPLTDIGNILAHGEAYLQKTSVSKDLKVYHPERRDEKNLNRFIVNAIDNHFINNPQQFQAFKIKFWEDVKANPMSLREQATKLNNSHGFSIDLQTLPEGADYISGNEVFVDLSKFSPSPLN